MGLQPLFKKKKNCGKLFLKHKCWCRQTGSFFNPTITPQNQVNLKPPSGLVTQAKTFVWLVQYGSYFLYMVLWTYGPDCLDKASLSDANQGVCELQILSIFPPSAMLEAFPELW